MKLLKYSIYTYMNISGIPVFPSILEKEGGWTFLGDQPRAFYAQAFWCLQVQTKESEMQLLWNVLINYIYFT